MTITGPARIVATDMELRSGAQIVIDASAGPVKFYVHKDFILSSNTSIASTTFDPADLSINLASDNIINPTENVQLAEVLLQSNSMVYGTLFAPNAMIDIDSNFELFGSRHRASGAPGQLGADPLRREPAQREQQLRHHDLGSRLLEATRLPALSDDPRPVHRSAAGGPAPGGRRALPGGRARGRARARSPGGPARDPRPARSRGSLARCADRAHRRSGPAAGRRAPALPRAGPHRRLLRDRPRLRSDGRRRAAHEPLPAEADPAGAGAGRARAGPVGARAPARALAAAAGGGRRGPLHGSRR